MADKLVETVAALRARSEQDKDSWLFGGVSLFHSLLAAGLVDTVEVAVSPVLLGGGIPLLATTGQAIETEADWPPSVQGWNRLVAVRGTVIVADVGPRSPPRARARIEALLGGPVHL